MLRVTGLFLLAFWLILQGFLSLTRLHLPYEKSVLAVFAFTAGLILLLDMFRSRLDSLGMLLLSIWLLLRGSMTLFHYSFPYSEAVTACLAIAAGLFLLVKRK